MLENNMPTYAIHPTSRAAMGQWMGFPSLNRDIIFVSNREQVTNLTVYNTNSAYYIASTWAE